MSILDIVIDCEQRRLAYDYIASLPCRERLIIYGLMAGMQVTEVANAIETSHQYVSSVKVEIVKKIGGYLGS